jgi:hypothetical protein
LCVGGKGKANEQYRYWAEYNEGLTRLTDGDKSGPVVVAKGCGHFIQKDNSGFVAELVVDMLGRLGW